MERSEEGDGIHSRQRNGDRRQRRTREPAHRLKPHGIMHPNPAFNIEHRALDHRQFFPFPRPGSRVVWKRRRYLWGVVGLHEEIEDFIKFMEPTDIEQAMRDDVVRRIRNIVTDLWPSAKLETFGSYNTGLYLPDGDIDMVIFGQWEQPPLWILRNKLLEQGITREENISVIEKAVVPIIKLIDSQTLVHIDISFNTSNGQEAAGLVKSYLGQFPLLKQLVMLLKYILNHRGLNEVWTGGLGSYALTLLVVNFFQQHPRESAPREGENLGTLLLEFLELYGRNFNYEQNGIRVRDGAGYVPIDQLREQMIVHGNKYGPLCIEDPLNVTNDVGRSTYQWTLVRTCFDHCCRKLKKALEDQPDPAMRGGTLLGQILGVSHELLLYRHWCNATFRTEARQSSSSARHSKNSVTSSSDESE
jgi:non-canonical poly(A) RNA polymerase PAPD5/7